MAHGYAVTDSDRGKFHRNTAGHCHAEFYSLCDLVQVHVAWDDLIVGIDNTDQRSAHLL